MRTFVILLCLSIPLAASAQEPSSKPVVPQPRSRPATAGKPDEAPETAPPPWTERALRLGIKVGQRWVYAFEMKYWVGMKKETRRERVEVEVIAIGMDSYKLRERTYDESGKLTKDRDKTASYTQANEVYGRFLASETNLSNDAMKAAGRLWQAKVYVNRRKVEGQDLELTIWNSKERPGLVLKTSFKGTRLSWEGILVEYHAAKGEPALPPPGAHRSAPQRD